jgi:hypothetical protein
MEFKDLPADEVADETLPLEIQVLTQSDKFLDLIKLTPEDIDLEDIAHSLSMQCRYNGHVKKFYSVAEHSVKLAQYILDTEKDEPVRTILARVALMHDAAEAYVGDIIYNLKAILYEFEVIEEFVFEKILERFKMRQEFLMMEQPIKIIDRRICIDEMQKLCTRLDPELEDYQPLGIIIENWSPEVAKERFLWMAEQLKITEKETD